MKTLAKYVLYSLLALAVISLTACSNPFSYTGELTAYDPYMKPKFVTYGTFQFRSNQTIYDENTGKVYRFDNYVFEPES